MVDDSNEKVQSTHTIFDITFNLGGGIDGQEGRFRSKISKNPPELDTDEARKISSEW